LVQTFDIILKTIAINDFLDKKRRHADGTAKVEIIAPRSLKKLGEEIEDS